MNDENLWEKNILKYQEILQDSRSLLISVQNNPNTDMLEAIQSLLSAKLLTAIRAKENPDLAETKEWVNMLSRLTNTQIKIAKMRLSFSHTIQEAKEAIINELALSLKNHPQMLQEISNIVQQTQISL